jgi:hypothetical protein
MILTLNRKNGESKITTAMETVAWPLPSSLDRSLKPEPDGLLNDCDLIPIRLMPTYLCHAAYIDAEQLAFVHLGSDAFSSFNRFLFTIKGCGHGDHGAIKCDLDAIWRTVLDMIDEQVGLSRTVRHQL